jgi:hypothetical protein
LWREPEPLTLFGPGERHRTEEPFQDQSTGLPTFGDRFHDVGGKVGKPQDPPRILARASSLWTMIGTAGCWKTWSSIAGDRARDANAHALRAIRRGTSGSPAVLTKGLIPPNW